MDIKAYLDELGIEIKLESQEKIAKSEKRYVFIIEIVGKKKRVYSNKIPNIDIKKAKELAITKIKINKDDIMTIRCLEITYANVPVETMLTQTKWEIQPIYSRWMNPEELKEISVL